MRTRADELFQKILLASFSINVANYASHENEFDESECESLQRICQIYRSTMLTNENHSVISGVLGEKTLQNYENLESETDLSDMDDFEPTDKLVDSTDQ